MARRVPDNTDNVDNDEDLTDFERLVLDAVETTAPGEVVTYGELAAEVGRPGAARAVGAVLRRRGGRVAWWRVVASNGRLVPGGEERHARQLRAEGVVVRNGRVVMRS